MKRSLMRHGAIVAGLLGVLLWAHHRPYIEGESYSASTRYLLRDGSEVTGTDRLTITHDQLTYTATENWDGHVRNTRITGSVSYANRWELRWRITDLRDSDPSRDALLMLVGEDLFLGRQVAQQPGVVLRVRFVPSGSDRVLCFYFEATDRFRCLSQVM